MMCFFVYAPESSPNVVGSLRMFGSQVPYMGWGKRSLKLVTVGNTWLGLHFHSILYQQGLRGFIIPLIKKSL